MPKNNPIHLPSLKQIQTKNPIHNMLCFYVYTLNNKQTRQTSKFNIHLCLKNIKEYITQYVVDCTCELKKNPGMALVRESEIEHHCI